MRRTTALTTTTLLGLALLSPTAAVAVVSCQGAAATILGAPNQDVTGTEGRDVVVTNGASGVTTLGGDDLVCITARDAHRGYHVVDVDAGTGDDVVDGRQTTHWIVRGELGAGSDRFLGGAADDFVAAGTSTTTGAHVDTEADVLVGGAGQDQLTSGQSGTLNADAVDGGQDGDTLVHHGLQAATGSLAGGTEDDLLVTPLPPGATAIDNVTGRLTTTEGAIAWTSIEGFTLRPSVDGPREVTFVGNDAHELLEVRAPAVLVVDMGGGDDLVAARPAPMPGSRIDAGPGQDLFVAHAHAGALDLRLSAQRLRVHGDSSHRVPVREVENAALSAPRVILAGSSKNNWLYADGCRLDVSGRGGRDLLVLGTVLHFRRHPADCARRGLASGGSGRDSLNGTIGPDTLRGGPGHDHVSGSAGADLVLGGPGTDRVDGGLHRDTCRAEHERRCER